jgi:hypothetical protein
MLHQKGKIAPRGTKIIIGMVEVEIIPSPMLKPRLEPPMEEDPNVGIRMKGKGVGTLGILMDVKEDTVSVPHIKGYV